MLFCFYVFMDVVSFFCVVYIGADPLPIRQGQGPHQNYPFSKLSPLSSKLFPLSSKLTTLSSKLSSLSSFPHCPKSNNTKSYSIILNFIILFCWVFLVPLHSLDICFDFVEYSYEDFILVKHVYGKSFSLVRVL